MFQLQLAERCCLMLFLLLIVLHHTVDTVLTLWLNISVSCRRVVYWQRCCRIISIRSTSNLSSSWRQQQKNDEVPEKAEAWSDVSIQFVQTCHLTRLVVTISSNHLDWDWLYRSTQRIRSSPAENQINQTDQGILDFRKVLNSTNGEPTWMILHSWNCTPDDCWTKINWSDFSKN